MNEKLTYDRVHDFIGDLWCCGRPDLLEAAMVHEDWEWIKPQLREVFAIVDRAEKKLIELQDEKEAMTHTQRAFSGPWDDITLLREIIGV